MTASKTPPGARARDARALPRPAPPPPRAGAAAALLAILLAPAAPSALALEAAALPSATPSQVAEGAPPGAPPPEDAPRVSPFAAELAAYISALERSGRFHVTRGDVGFELRLFPDAFDREALARLQDALARGKSSDHVLSSLRKEARLLRRLRRLPGLRIDLVHPPDDAPGPDAPPRPVHFLPAELTAGLRLRIGGEAVSWQVWRAPDGLEVTTVRVARHWTVRDHRRVPVISPIEPGGRRAVFTGRRARIDGVLPRGTLRRKSGRVTLTVGPFEEFRGPYDRNHLIDLNEESHHLLRDLEARVDGALPLLFPRPPQAVAEFLESARRAVAKAREGKRRA